MSKEKLLKELKPYIISKYGKLYLNGEMRVEGLLLVINQAIDQTREETIREVEGILEEITPAYIGVLESNNNRRYYEQGFGEYKEEIKQSLKSLINK